MEVAVISKQNHMKVNMELEMREVVSNHIPRFEKLFSVYIPLIKSWFLLKNEIKLLLFTSTYI